MTALRAMLQLRPGTSSLSSSPSHTSPAFSAKDSRPLSTSASPTFSYLHSHQPTISSNTLTTSPATALTPTTKTRPTTATTTTTSTSHSSSKKPYNLGLHSGAASGNLGLVKFALDNGQPIDSAVNGVLPIHAACCSNANVAVVLFLIERGADVNARRYPRKYSGERVGAQTVGTTGSTPLHFAAANGCLTIVEILLRHGATADLADKYGTTPYTVAVARNHPEVASLLHQHACMQRGLQIITPELNLRDSRDRDPFTSPRSSGDFSRRVSAIMAPTRACTEQLDSETTSFALLTSPQPLSGTPSISSSRILSQRRVSLPSIMESPSSPATLTVPRQSCDLGRAPLSRGSPNSNAELTDSTLLHTTQRMSTSPPSVQLLTANHRSSAMGQDSKDKDKQQQSSFIQSPWPSLMNTLEPAFNTSRRRSVDIATTGYPSPPSATPSLYRRASLDLITATNSTDNDIGRDSDASTSETAVSDPPSCSTFVNPMMPESNDSKSLLEIQVSADSAEKSRVESSPMGRSVSQSLRSLGRGATRRASSASEPNARQSFDLRSFAFSRGRMAPQEEEVEENGYSSTPRRRSIQESFGFSGNDQDEKSFFSHPSGMTSSASASSIHETSLQGHNNTSKHRASFSGSATISGRFSRFWSYGPAKDGQEGGVHGKDGFADSLQSIDGGNGDWNTEATAFHQSNKYAAGGRPRVGVMNRFSGMWSRR